MDNRIWENIKAGDKRAFRLFFDEYYSSLCIYANSIINDMELSQDLVSECFIRIWERKDRIQIKTSVKNYLLLTIRNSIYSYLRSPLSRKSNTETIIERLENLPVEEYNLERDEAIQKVYKLIEELPGQQRKILEMATLQGKTYKEISYAMGISVNTVNTQISRAYRFLRERLSINEFLLCFLLKKN